MPEPDFGTVGDGVRVAAAGSSGHAPLHAARAPADGHPQVQRARRQHAAVTQLRRTPGHPVYCVSVIPPVCCSFVFNSSRKSAGVFPKVRDLWKNRQVEVLISLSYISKNKKVLDSDIVCTYLLNMDKCRPVECCSFVCDNDLKSTPTPTK